MAHFPGITCTLCLYQLVFLYTIGMRSTGIAVPLTLDY